MLTTGVAVWLMCCSPKQREAGADKEKAPVTQLSPSELVALGRKLFNGKGSCAACHELNAVHIGPSAAQIARVYKEKKGDMVKFLQGRTEALVVPAQYGIMQTNFVVTQRMSQRELQALEAFIMSCDK